MNGETSAILQIFETVSVVGILGLIVYLFFSGKLISRKVHDEILEIYKREIKKITEALSTSLKDISKSQEETLEFLKKLNGKT